MGYCQDLLEKNVSNFEKLFQGRGEAAEGAQRSRTARAENRYESRTRTKFRNNAIAIAWSYWVTAWRCSRAPLPHSLIVWE